MPTTPQVRFKQFETEEIGMGFNNESGLAIGTALEGFEVHEDPSAPGQVVTSSITIVTSHEELMSKLNMSFAAQGRYGFFSASAKAEFSDSSNFNSTSTFLLARCVVRNPLKRGKGFRVTGPAQALLSSNRFDEFKRAFGDGFVRGLQTGGEFYSVVRITSVSTTHQSSLAASLQAEANGLIASGSFKLAFANANSQESTRSEFVATMFQMAGSGASISPVAEISEVIARWKSFPAIVAAAPVAYETEVATYDTLPLPLPTPEEQEDFLLAMVDAREKKLRYIQTRNDLEFARIHPLFFEGLPSSDILLTNTNTYAKLINAVVNHATMLSRGQISPPVLFDPTGLTPPIIEPAPVPLARSTSSSSVSMPNMVGLDSFWILPMLQCLFENRDDDRKVNLCMNLRLGVNNELSSPLSREVVEFLAFIAQQAGPFIPSKLRILEDDHPGSMSHPGQEGYVFVRAQLPAAGTLVSKGSEVVLFTEQTRA
jgi:hypothetical protein